MNRLGRLLVEFDLRNVFHPVAPGEQGNGDGNAKECLRQRGVGGGNRRRQKEQHRQAAENCLRNHRAQSGDAQPFHPAAAVASQVQTAMDNGEQPDRSAIMRWVCSTRTPPTNGGILYSDPNEVGQSGTERPASLLVTSAPAMSSRRSRRRENSEAMERAIVGCGEAFRSDSLGRFGRASIAPAGRVRDPPPRDSVSQELLRFEIWSTVLLSLAASVTFGSARPVFPARRPKCSFPAAGL